MHRPCRLPNCVPSYPALAEEFENRRPRDEGRKDKGQRIERMGERLRCARRIVLCHGAGAIGGLRTSNRRRPAGLCREMRDKRVNASEEAANKLPTKNDTCPMMLTVHRC